MRELASHTGRIDPISLPHRLSPDSIIIIVVVRLAGWLAGWLRDRETGASLRCEPRTSATQADERRTSLINFHRNLGRRRRGWLAAGNLRAPPDVGRRRLPGRKMLIELCRSPERVELDLNWNSPIGRVNCPESSSFASALETLESRPRQRQRQSWPSRPSRAQQRQPLPAWAMTK